MFETHLTTGPGMPTAERPLARLARSLCLSTALSVVALGAASAPAWAGSVCEDAGTGDNNRSFAFGVNATSCGFFSVADKNRSTAISEFSSALGTNSTAVGQGSAAGGIVTSISGGTFVVIGTNNVVNDNTTAIGQGAQAGATANGQVNATAVGQGAQANAANGTALGQNAQAQNSGSVAIGQGSVANRDNTVSVGGGGVGTRQITNVAAGTQGTDAVNLTQLNTALGNIAAAPFVSNGFDGAVPPVASGIDAVAGGYRAQATGGLSTAIGYQATASAGRAAALGYNARATGQSSAALGTSASASGNNSVALGADSVADQANTVSVGAAGAERRVVNVAAGTLSATSTDAVNGAQLFATNQNVTNNGNAIAGTATALGGGASYNPATGTFTAPTYTFGGGTTFNTVGGALGNLDTRTTQNTTAITVLQGQTATNTVNITALQNGQSGPFRADNSGGYAAPQASGQNAVAGGFGAVASGSSATAIGTNAQATQGGATAIGAGAVASGDPTTAVGFGAQATGNEASAFGGLATASATNATALGRSAAASGTNAVAVGAFSSASQANSVALGTGVTTTRANQVAIGASSQTYTLAGLSSAQSSAAQTGPTRFVGTDASGNLAASAYGPSDIASLDGRVSNLEAAYGLLRRDVRSAFSGTAISLALAGAVLPPGKNYALSGGFGTYHGQTAFGASGVARISDNLYATGGVGFATNGSSNVGGRAGLTYAW